jgi:hypothetical protein
MNPFDGAHADAADEHGRYSDSLEALAPGTLDTVPHDSFHVSKRLVRLGFGLMLAPLLVVVFTARLANPWVRWRPPEIVLPVPNAYDDYQRAAELAKDDFESDGNPEKDAAVRRRVLARHTEALRTLRAGFAHPYVEPREEGIPKNAYHSTGYRQLARLLSYEATEFAADGRYAAAIDSGLDAERFGFDIARGTGILGRFVGEDTRRKGRAEKLVQPRIDHLTAAEARAAAERLAALLAGEQDLAQTFADLRDIEPADIAARCRDHGLLRQFFVSMLDPPQKLVLTACGPAPWMAEARRYMDAAAAWSRLPWHAAPPPRPRRFFGLWTARSVEQSRCKQAEADARDGMFLSALALQAWRAEHGRYPDSLDALAPGILQAVPADPFGSGELKYRREGEKYVLYSVGPDGRDDGGTAVQKVDDQGRTTHRIEPDSVGDIVWGISEF